jgi:signal transduction histidine kinase
MTAAPGRAELHPREQLWRWWILLLAGAWLVTLLAFAFGAGAAQSARDRLVGVGLLVALALLYGLVGYPAVRVRDDRRAAIYLALVIVIVGWLLRIDPIASTLLFGLYPQCYSGFRRLSLGTISALALTGAVALAALARSGWSADAVPGILLWSGFSAGFGLLLAAWIGRIIRQSVQRAELIAELERTRGALAESHRLDGMRVERERLAGEIHDTLAQGFTSIVLLAQAAQADAARRDDYLRSIEATARDNLAEARALVNDLGPSGLQGTALVSAIRRIADVFAAETGVDVEFRAAGEARPLSADHDVVLLRAAQESVANVRKHAAAGHVTVELVYGPEVRLSVSDDGRGFDPALAQGFGLDALRRRVAQAGGTARVTSAPGQGSRVEVELP